MTHHHPASARSWARGLLGLVVVVGGLAFGLPAFAATVSAGGPYTGAEGQHLAIQGTVSGASGGRWSAVRAPGGEQDGATCKFADPTALSTEVWCNDDGTFDLHLTASDGTTSTARLTLRNVAPVLTRVRPVPGTAVGAHSVVRVSARYRDPGPVDSHKYVIHWGDGRSSRAATRERLSGTGSFSGSHSYARGGIRKVTVTILDSHGGRDRARRALQVVAGSSCAKVAGAGRLPGHPSSHFALRAHCGSSRAVGAVRLRVPGTGQFASTHLTLLRGRGRAATMAGIGRWQSGGASHARYRYVMSVQDRRAGRDQMSVTVRNAAGVPVLHLRGGIAGGTITVRR